MYGSVVVGNLRMTAGSEVGRRLGDRISSGSIRSDIGQAFRPPDLGLELDSSFSTTNTTTIPSRLPLIDHAFPHPFIDTRALCAFRASNIRPAPSITGNFVTATRDFLTTAHHSRSPQHTTRDFRHRTSPSRRATSTTSPHPDHNTTQHPSRRCCWTGSISAVGSQQTIARHHGAMSRSDALGRMSGINAVTLQRMELAWMRFQRRAVGCWMCA
ncbi:hypothetical protein M409DRAFT_61596 [Zasmidium cellare ATCC 36951]|uniref:Uncharacterized protein n=1 Tax=Zasmidium cellare ATCC 36951 TaxID=1080233 RepID=A0A6A6BVE0_ZASCE|nr:uncharacterized protein M409DRAFT_61596 [Zasmidium cellare ATCC 36951]KAF2158493.1 hypothetical protein M409DRAFT_61596 [Zasmidium cellare ATCC 36951]